MLFFHMMCKREGRKLFRVQKKSAEGHFCSSSGKDEFAPGPNCTLRDAGNEKNTGTVAKF